MKNEDVYHEVNQIEYAQHWDEQYLFFNPES